MFTVNLNHRVEVELCVMFVDLEYRIDYQLREASFSNSYISMLTSHTSYWTDRDVAFFVLSHIHPELQDLWQPRSAEFHLKTLYYNFITQVYNSSCLYLSLFFKPTNFCSKRIFFLHMLCFYLLDGYCNPKSFKDHNVFLKYTCTFTLQSCNCIILWIKIG